MISFARALTRVISRHQVRNKSWNPMRDQDKAKKQAAERALEAVGGGQVIGLGTGSTAKFVIEGLGRLVREGLSIKGVPTSIATERLARELGIPIVDLNDVGVIDI